MLLCVAAIGFSSCEKEETGAIYTFRNDFVNSEVKNLAIRTWECPNCKEQHQRDVNASINILHKGLQLQSA